MGIKVIVCKVGEEPTVTEIEPDLDAMQAVVDGYIERVQLDDGYAEGVDLWCNEDGLFTCEPNRLVAQRPIHGDFFLARHDSDGNTVSLTDADVDKWLPILEATPVAFTLNSL